MPHIMRIVYIYIYIYIYIFVSAAILTQAVDKKKGSTHIDIWEKTNQQADVPSHEHGSKCNTKAKHRITGVHRITGARHRVTGARLHRVASGAQNFLKWFLA